MVEYCVLVALISIVAIAAVQNLGWTVENTFVTATIMSGGIQPTGGGG